MKDTDNKPEDALDVFDASLIPQELSTLAVETRYMGIAEFEDLINKGFQDIDVEEEEEGS